MAVCTLHFIAVTHTPLPFAVRSHRGAGTHRFYLTQYGTQPARFSHSATTTYACTPCLYIFYCRYLRHAHTPFLPSPYYLHGTALANLRCATGSAVATYLHYTTFSHTGVYRTTACWRRCTRIAVHSCILFTFVPFTLFVTLPCVLRCPYLPFYPHYV